uniref:LRR19 n=1 Tax=Triticum aestivum TaxID=4565 RepID=D0QEJ2_WHEAT|nr:LRR19 [Triticum aestivum]
MQAYLQEAERFKDNDKTTTIFVDEIRGLAYKLEYCKHGGFAGKMKKRRGSSISRPGGAWQPSSKKSKPVRKLGSRNSRSQRRRRFLRRVQSCDFSRFLHCYLFVTRKERQIDESCGHRRALPFTRDEDLVGIEEHKERLIQWLTSGGEGQEQSSSKVTLVWGMLGVGKTTLVDYVYNTVKEDFDAAAWITVSDSYRTEDLLKKISAQLSITVDVANIEMRGLAKFIDNYLQGAFWNADDKKCPLELQELARKFIAKCQGLPIATACIGRLLSCKPQNSAKWEDVYRCLDSQFAKDVIPHAHLILKKAEDWGRKAVCTGSATCQQYKAEDIKSSSFRTISALLELEQKKTLLHAGEGNVSVTGMSPCRTHKWHLTELDCNH